MNKMRANTDRKNTENKLARRGTTGGFSIIELVMVLVIIGIMSALSIPLIVNYKKQLKSEDQALKMMDLMREASQLALTRRRLMRFEIDLTNNRMLLIDGRNAGPADDILIKALPLEDVQDIRIDQIPAGVTRPNPPNYNDAAYVNDTVGHLYNGVRVVGNRVWQISFLSNGSAVNAANNPLSGNIYFWTPLTPGSASPKNIKEVRAITIFGGSGAVRYWKHNGTTFLPTN